MVPGGKWLTSLVGLGPTERYLRNGPDRLPDYPLPRGFRPGSGRRGPRDDYPRRRPRGRDPEYEDMYRRRSVGHPGMHPGDFLSPLAPVRRPRRRSIDYGGPPMRRQALLPARRGRRNEPGCGCEDICNEWDSEMSEEEGPFYDDFSDFDDDRSNYEPSLGGRSFVRRDPRLGFHDHGRYPHGRRHGHQPHGRHPLDRHASYPQPDPRYGGMRARDHALPGAYGTRLDMGPRGGYAPSSCTDLSW